jgi:hypothetical protein
MADDISSENLEAELNRENYYPPEEESDEPNVENYYPPEEESDEPSVENYYPPEEESDEPSVENYYPIEEESDEPEGHTLIGFGSEDEEFDVPVESEIEDYAEARELSEPETMSYEFPENEQEDIYDEPSREVSLIDAYSMNSQEPSTGHLSYEEVYPQDETDEEMDHFIVDDDEHSFGEGYDLENELM